MAKYSRTDKYRDLRATLQNDSEADIRTNDLNPYKKKLNEIAPAYFDAPEATAPERVTAPVHSHQSKPYTPEEQPVQMPSRETASGNGYSKDYFKNNANYTTAFNNEYIDDYIREVKEYNIGQGVADSANTDLDILRSLRNDPKPAPRKPYPDEPVEVSPKEVSKPSYSSYASEPAKPAVKEADTADISFGREKHSAAERPASVPIKEKPAYDFLDDEPEEEEDDRPRSDTQAMTKEDIAAEVQRLINGAQKNNADKKPKRKSLFDDEDDKDDYYNSSHSTNQRILNETTQMRAQLDDYEDDLNDVNDRMKHTNQILNIVLIILIVALSLVLAVVIYWVLLSKGVIG